MSKGAAVTYHHHHPMSDINYQVNIKRMPRGQLSSTTATYQIYVNYQVDFLVSLSEIDADSHPGNSVTFLLVLQ